MIIQSERNWSNTSNPVSGTAHSYLHAEKGAEITHSHNKTAITKF